MYRATNGTSVPGSTGEDDRDFGFFRLDRLTRVECSAVHFYFAEFMQSMHQFAVEAGRPGDDAPGAVFYVAGPLAKLTDTFADFIELYLSDDISLYRGPG